MIVFTKVKLMLLMNHSCETRILYMYGVFIILPVVGGISLKLQPWLPQEPNFIDELHLNNCERAPLRDAVCKVRLEQAKRFLRCPKIVDDLLMGGVSNI